MSTKTSVDIQIDNIQRAVVLKAKSTLSNINNAIRVMEQNGGKPEMAFNNLQDAKIKLKNLVSDLQSDTRY